MNHDKENKASNRTLAVGWFDNAPFRTICVKYLSRIKEVFFAWPGVTASRPMAEWTPERKQLFFEDIAWCRAEGMELDAIFNANCYGDIAISKALAEHVSEVLSEMGEKGLFPEHLTTTSPFIATVVRRRFPDVKIRLSVNMYIESTQSLSYMEELFDSFYVSIDNHRNFEHVRKMADWSTSHGKTLCVYVNSGCLRDCPFRQFHNNRPEELPEYERLAGVVKLATRRHPDPEGIIRAYATYSYDGDLAKIMDPFFDFPVPIDNATLGKSALWPAIRDCPDAHNCRRCGKCDALMDELSRRSGRIGESAVAQTFAGFFKG